MKILQVKELVMSTTTSPYFIVSMLSAGVGILSAIGVFLSKVMNLIGRVSTLEVKVEQITESIIEDKKDLDALELRLTEQLIRIESKIDAFLLKDK